ncbi:Putative transcriptional regulator, MerR family (N-terminal fragment), authentic frameshift [Latilactobacillus sakei subsp. sakei 23K]|uniref:Transcriptional regulator, MerR family (N-terminal), authentic frameshift n=1 Tax=Latilactobacillus sakei subsp. sakei (strain 23K) TaxID=314315 RepID=Q38Z48_LATSS|nr:MerR family DNA-binding transcriptional regulator [Latilactobacillus sakei]CAI54529.1 Putative transcriptional regulator, MerR family (N-terminal fragment), authentic frameshift [Latilactobacillus sakei subsp. sakei 23K]
MNIKEASQQTGVTATTIRYYEKEGLIQRLIATMLACERLTTELLEELIS